MKVRNLLYPFLRGQPLNNSQFGVGGSTPYSRLYSRIPPKGLFSVISKRPTKRKCIFGGNTSMKIKILKIDAATLLLMKGLSLLSKSERSLPV